MHDILSSTFALFVIPERLYYDNGPQYSSPVSSTLAAQWEVEHVTSYPHYPQSNGLIERHLQTIEQTLKKSDNFQRTLLGLTPSPSLGGDGDDPTRFDTPSPLNCWLRQNIAVTNIVRHKSRKWPHQTRPRQAAIPGNDNDFVTQPNLVTYPHISSTT